MFLHSTKGLRPHDEWSGFPLGTFKKQSGQVGTVGTGRRYLLPAVPTFSGQVGTVGTTQPKPSRRVRLQNRKPLHNFYGMGRRWIIRHRSTAWD